MSAFTLTPEDLLDLAIAAGVMEQEFQDGQWSLPTSPDVDASETPNAR